MDKRIETDEKSLREQIPYHDETFPVGAWTDVYSEFVGATVNSHWHYDFEYGCVLSGKVDYYINDTHVSLGVGDCVFVNSNMMHMSRQPENCGNAKMVTITFPSTLLSKDNNSTVYDKYIRSILGKEIEGFVIASDCKHGSEMWELITGIHAMDASVFGYELECLQRINRLWLVTLLHISENEGSLLRFAGNIQQARRVQEILVYIHKHYKERILIEDIVAHMNISRSECFRCFKKFTNKRPIEYINDYRLSKVAQLLSETDKSITEIYSECGFESASYFGRVFKEKYGMTPLKFRKK